MHLQGYRDFVEAFERLTPYELDHFSKLFHQFFASSKKVEIQNPKQEDLRDILTRAMQAAHMEIAQQKIETAKLDFDMVRSRLLLTNNG